MLSSEQMAGYERDGAVVVDLGLPEDFLVALEAAWLRLGSPSAAPHRPPLTNPMLEEPAVVALLQHESLERIAQQVLRSDIVHVFDIGRSDRPAASSSADPENVFDKHGHQTEWAQGMHSGKHYVQQAIRHCVCDPRAFSERSVFYRRASRQR